MPKTIHFNTGRLYSSGGQKITATLHDDGVVTFFDHTRLVDKEFSMSRFPHATDIDPAIVMAAYDAGEAKSSQRSFEDGMMTGGCNTRFQEA
jgi:hypothetical protein